MSNLEPTTTKKVDTKTSYADVLKGPGGKAKRGPAIRDWKTSKREHVAIIYPAEEGVTSSQTLNLIQNNIHPSKLCVGVKRVRHLRKGGLAVVTSTNQEVDKLIKVLTTEKGVREKVFVGRPKLQKPKIILYGVNEVVDLKEIPDLLSENETHCINCEERGQGTGPKKNFNHEAGSRLCPIIIRDTKRLRTRVDYGH